MALAIHKRKHDSLAGKAAGVTERNEAEYNAVTLSLRSPVWGLPVSLANGRPLGSPTGREDAGVARGELIEAYSDEADQEHRI